MYASWRYRYIFSAVDFGGSLGIAFRGSACSNNQAPVGLTGTKSWTKSHTKADVASTVAHELGHILGLRHTDGRKLFTFSMLQG